MPELHVPAQRARTTLYLLLAIWSGLALYTFTVELTGLLTVDNWRPALLKHLKFVTLNIWLPWLLLAPLTIAFARRFPVTPANALARIAMHVLVLLLLSLLHLAAIATLFHFTGARHDPGMAHYAAWQHMGHFLVGDAILLFNAIIYTLLVASNNIGNYFALLQQKQRDSELLNARLQEAQLQALKMQINPHFLFNTLNGIAVQVLKQRNELAVSMIHQLSRFFRRTLEESQRQFQPLAQELELVALYLSLEKLRFADRLSVLENYAPATMTIPVPTMLLQPLIENALRHGLGEKEGPGLLTVRSRLEHERLCITISDDGAGCDFDDKTHYKEGIGIANVRARLQQIYGEDCMFALHGTPGQGVTVRLELPIHGADLAHATAPQ